MSELCLHRTVVERKGEYLRIERGFETVTGYATRMYLYYWYYIVSVQVHLVGHVLIVEEKR